MRRFLISLSIAMSVAISSLASLPALAKPNIIIILDDLGYRPTDVAAFSLPKEVAFSILPQTPLSKSIAQRAENEGRPVMLHMPMQATNHKSMGPLGLSTDMFPGAIIHTLRKAIKSVPNAIGVNNHMGSAFTEQEDAMKALMEEIKRQGLFFVDSRTTVLTKAQAIAERVGVPNASRQIFLDHQRNRAFLERQFKRMKEIAKVKGYVVVIGHPHPETIAFLKQELPALAVEGFNLLSIADYFSYSDQNDQLFATYPNDSSVSSPNE
ncbi:divergent polysaccharide deacetylase family protein [Alteromonas sp. A081]|uniref:divergent polysaccharide deacetylase family protein n=1 Tax=Alteromonas sp. A081 TaxID=3410269 RepID=UPI003B97EB65